MTSLFQHDPNHLSQPPLASQQQATEDTWGERGSFLTWREKTFVFICPHFVATCLGHHKLVLIDTYKFYVDGTEDTLLSCFSMKQVI